MLIPSLPSHLKPEVIALLTASRQKILIELLQEEQTLSRLAERVSINIQPSSLFESLDILEKNGLVKKDKNKVYSITKDGMLVGLILLKPNGIKENKIRELLDKVLRDEFCVLDEEERRDLIDNFRQLGEHITETKKEACEET